MEFDMTQGIFAIVRDVQEILISMQAEDREIREIMLDTASVEDLAPHFRALRYYESKLQPLLNEFESETFKEQLPEELSNDAAG